MSDKTYDILAMTGRIILPAISTLYFTLAQIWNLPLGEQVTGTLAAVTVFLNSILRIQSKAYYAEQDETEDCYCDEEEGDVDA